jgi:hypothetical protein
MSQANASLSQMRLAVNGRGKSVVVTGMSTGLYGWIVVRSLVPKESSQEETHEIVSLEVTKQISDVAVLR